MIYGRVKDLIKQKGIYAQLFSKIIDYIEKADINTLKNGQYKIGKCRLIISEYETVLPEKKISESHKKNIDLHIILSGTESIGVGREDRKNLVAEEYHTATDSKTYRYVKNIFFIDLPRGYYAIFFPEEIHKPGCAPKNGKGMVKKAVIKIPVEK